MHVKQSIQTLGLTVVLGLILFMAGCEGTSAAEDSAEEAQSTPAVTWAAIESEEAELQTEDEVADETGITVVNQESEVIHITETLKGDTVTLNIDLDVTDYPGPSSAFMTPTCWMLILMNGLNISFRERTGTRLPIRWTAWIYLRLNTTD